MARKESPNKRRGRPLSSSPSGDDGAAIKVLVSPSSLST